MLYLIMDKWPTGKIIKGKTSPHLKGGEKKMKEKKKKPIMEKSLNPLFNNEDIKFQ